VVFVIIALIRKLIIENISSPSIKSPNISATPAKVKATGNPKKRSIIDTINSAIPII
jgi:hypothetical protein